MRPLFWFLSRFYFPLLALLTLSCSSVRHLAISKDVNKIVKDSPIFSQYFVGFSLYDPTLEKTIIDINGDKYFTPASNTKILTLAAWLSMDRDSIPSFLLSRDAQVIRPLGDPVFLHPDFPNQSSWQKIYQMTGDTLKIELPENNISNYGPGWAWDDYSYDFQVERSVFPLYGNVIRTVVEDTSYYITPDFFKGFVDINARSNRRTQYANIFELSIDSQLGDSAKIDIPYIVSKELTLALLADTLHKHVQFTQGTGTDDNWDTIYSHTHLPVLSTMMLRSDNFLAEQLLINAQLSTGFKTTEGFIAQTLESVFKKMNHPPIWVDGSGLSRYNMVTPNGLTQILLGLYNQLSWDEINILFPTGGVNGTIKNWYAADEPYVYAKTGTLRHNHNLSGFLTTKSGKRLIFSFMNNHYSFSNVHVKTEMQKLLEAIRDNY